MFSTYSVVKMSGLAALMGLLAAIPAAGQDVVQDPPPELSFLSTILKVRKNISYEPWGEVKVALDADGGPFKRGKHWFIIAETANGSDPVMEWNKIKPAFLQNGWTLVKEYRGGGLPGGAAIREERSGGLGVCGLGRRAERLEKPATLRGPKQSCLLVVPLLALAYWPET